MIGQKKIGRPPAVVPPETAAMITHALLTFNFDREWRKKHGRVPIAALERACGISPTKLHPVMRRGSTKNILGAGAVARLSKMIPLILDGKIKFKCSHGTRRWTWYYVRIDDGATMEEAPHAMDRR